MKKTLLFSFICIAMLLTGCSRSATSGIPTRVDLAALGPENSDVFSQGNDSLQSGTYFSEDSGGVENRASGNVESGTRITVVTQETQQTYPTDDGSSALFYQQLQESTISVSADPAVEQAVNLALQENQEAARQESQGLLTMAEDSYTSMQTLSEDGALFYGYSYYTMDTVTRLDASVFSMTTYYSSYTGGAHPNNTQKAMNFDMESGDLLSLADVLLPAGESALETMILDWLCARADDYGLYDAAEYEAVSREKFGKDMLDRQFDSWYFSENGLVVFFNPYDIASYAAGVVKIEFPYSDLSYYLESRFFPVRVAGQETGSVSTGLSQWDAAAFETVEEIGADTGGPSVSICGDPQVYDLSLSWVCWAGDQPMTQSTVYVTSCLTDENLILVHLDSKEDLQNLCIRFNPGDGTMVTAYLNPETGEAAVSDNHGK